MTIGLLDEIMARLDKLPPEALQELMEERRKSGSRWIPNPGPQTDAMNSLADELFIGGAAGGGKSSFLVGMAVEHHYNSIIFRREYPQIKGLEEEATRIIGSRQGYNSSSHVWRIPGTERVLEFGSVPHEWDVEKYQGRAHALKGFDELPHFTRSQYRYLIAWNRSTRPGERCRVIGTGNPPTSPEQYWVVEHWAAWLDKNHPDPAKPGELRWPVRAEEDSDREIFFRTPEEAIEHLSRMDKPPYGPDGNIPAPRSRTFIPARLEDNPDLMATGYAAVLDSAPKDLREALRYGNFEAGIKDDEWQVIPTEWISEAQKRWTPKPPDDVPMTAMGVDVAQGGDDETVLAPRHDAWFAEIIAAPGAKTPNPSDAAALVVKHRRNGAAVIVDCGGGYGGGVVDWLKQNQIVAIPHKGSNSSARRTKDRLYGFFNKRAEVIWRFREALDPEQPGGSPIALPPDASLRADLASYRYSIEPRGILIEDKQEVKKRIGRSPDKGDAVVMSWSEGQAALHRGLVGPQATQHREMPKYANVGYAALKSRRR